MIAYDPKTDFFPAIGRDNPLRCDVVSLCKPAVRETASRLEYLESVISIARKRDLPAPFLAYRARRAEIILLDHLQFSGK